MWLLDPEEWEWLAQFRETLAARFAGVVVNMVLYGSKARGDAREDWEWLAQFRETLAARFAGVVVNMVLYGSKARGDAREDSDIDVLLVVRDAAARLKRPLRQLAHELAATSYALPSIMAYTEAEWAQLERVGSPFRAGVERDGVSVL